MKQWFAIVLAAPILLVAGCDKKPVGQVVAVVNGEEVGQQELNEELQSVPMMQVSSKQEVINRALDQIVTRKLLAQDAKQKQIDRTPEFIVRERRLNDALLGASMIEAEAKKLPLPSQAEIDRFVATHPTIFANRKRFMLERITFPTSTPAATLEQLRPLHSLDAIGATLSAANVQTTRTTGFLDTASLPPPVVLRLEELPAGEPFVVPEGDTFSANVIVKADPVAMNPEQIKPAAIQLIRNEKMSAIIQKEIKTIRSAAKIEYQSGFKAPTPVPGAPN